LFDNVFKDSNEVSSAGQMPEKFNNKEKPRKEEKPKKVDLKIIEPN
jgi:hypothetical protein